MSLHSYSPSMPPTPQPSHQNDHLDDIFGSEPSSPSQGPTSYSITSNSDISDIPRLKAKHETEGYRDGVTQGKAKTVQQGFDEGYGLGAVLGLHIGRILGLLEGICAAVRSGEKSAAVIGASTVDGEFSEWKGERIRLEALLQNAREELRTESVFGREWWGEDGIWKFDVPGEGEGMDVVFSDVVVAHPLIKKWDTFASQEVNRWELDLGIMEQDHDHGNEENTTTGKYDAAVPLDVGSTLQILPTFTNGYLIIYTYTERTHTKSAAYHHALELVKGYKYSRNATDTLLLALNSMGTFEESRGRSRKGG